LTAAVAVPELLARSVYAGLPGNPAVTQPMYQFTYTPLNRLQAITSTSGPQFTFVYSGNRDLISPWEPAWANIF